RWTEKQLRGGAVAADIASSFYQMFCDRGYRDNFVYGPCHGIGMIEVEAPWMESSSNYILQPNMTFQIDTFISGSTFGIRWEKGIVITPNGIESLCEPIGTIYELDF
ncbi:MAG: M24 family metallopeptidase, partial [Bacillota bacterium]|nr:M24 family metallopeptidase [Bacillota bacterium]